MGDIVTGATPMGIDLYNGLFCPEARVSAAVATATGRTYPTITAALAAGHRSIWVEAGIYTESPVITQQGVHIRGARSMRYYEETAGAMVKGQITVSASYVTIEDIGSCNSTGYGFRVDANTNHIYLLRCGVYNSAFHGIMVGYGSDNSMLNVKIRDCAIYEAKGDAIHIADLAATFSLDDILIDGCWLYRSTWYGIRVCYTTPTVVTAVQRIVKIANNTIRGCGLSATYHGVMVGPYASAIITGNDIWSSGGAGVRIETPLGTNARTVVSGNQLRSNSQSGVNCASSTALVAVIGNWATGNSGGNYALCNNAIGNAYNGSTV